jgi:uncharacterized protein YuzE
MRVTHDPQANAAYIYLVEIGRGDVAESAPCGSELGAGDVIADFDRSGRLLGIEVLNARETLPPEVLDLAERQ